ncbi:MAG: hypothetical protein P8Z49_11515 [Acidobacteriota bacterium]
MKRTVLAAFLALFAVSAGLSVHAGDVAVFRDHRSLNIDGYTVRGKWMVLLVPGGKMAVPINRIERVRDASSGRQLYPAAKKESVGTAKKGKRSKRASAKKSPDKPGKPVRKTRSDRE